MSLIDPIGLPKGRPGLFVVDGVADGYEAFAIAAASYFPLLFMSAWWRGMTMKGAATGMLGGGYKTVALEQSGWSDKRNEPTNMGVTAVF